MENEESTSISNNDNTPPLELQTQNTSSLTIPSVPSNNTKTNSSSPTYCIKAYILRLIDPGNTNTLFTTANHSSTPSISSLSTSTIPLSSNTTISSPTTKSIYPDLSQLLHERQEFLQDIIQKMKQI